MPSNEPQVYKPHRFPRGYTGYQAIQYTGHNREALAAFAEGSIFYAARADAQPGGNPESQSALLLLRPAGARDLTRVLPTDYVVRRIHEDDPENPPSQLKRRNSLRVTTAEEYAYDWTPPAQPDQVHDCAPLPDAAAGHPPNGIIALCYTGDNYAEAAYFAGGQLCQLALDSPQGETKTLTILTSPYRELVVVEPGDWLFMHLDDETGERQPDDLTCWPPEEFNRIYQPA